MCNEDGETGGWKVVPHYTDPEIEEEQLLLLSPAQDDDVSTLGDEIDDEIKALLEEEEIYAVEDYFYDLMFCRTPGSRDAWETDPALDGSQASRITFEGHALIEPRSFRPDDDPESMIKIVSAVSSSSSSSGSTQSDDEYTMATLESDIEEKVQVEDYEFRYYFNDYQSKCARGMEVHAVIVPRKLAVRHSSSSDNATTITPRKVYGTTTQTTARNNSFQFDSHSEAESLGSTTTNHHDFESKTSNQSDRATNACHDVLVRNRDDHPDTTPDANKAVPVNATTPQPYTNATAAEKIKSNKASAKKRKGLLGRVRKLIPKSNE